ITPWRPPGARRIPYTTLFRSRPPDGLDVAVMVGDVGTVAVHPYAEVLEDSSVRPNVCRGVIIAFGNELVYSDYVLDVFLSVEIRSEEHTSELRYRQELVCGRM